MTKRAPVGTTSNDSIRVSGSGFSHDLKKKSSRSALQYVGLSASGIAPFSLIAREEAVLLVRKRAERQAGKRLFTDGYARVIIQYIKTSVTRRGHIKRLIIFHECSFRNNLIYAIELPEIRCRIDFAIATANARRGKMPHLHVWPSLRHPLGRAVGGASCPAALEPLDVRLRKS